MEGRLDVETSNRPCGRISRSLAFVAMRKGEARMRRSKGPKPLRRTPLSDSPARRETPTVLKSAEPPYTDPYVRWCGRGGAARLSPIPIVCERTFAHPTVARFTRPNLLRQRALQRLLETVQLERLLQRRPIAIGLGQAALAVAGGEDERQAAGDQGLGHRPDRLAVEVDVENREVEVGGLRRLQGFLDAPGLGGDGVAELAQHVLEQHADHQLVLDEQDALGALARGRALGRGI